MVNKFVAAEAERDAAEDALNTVETEVTAHSTVPLTEELVIEYLDTVSAARAQLSTANLSIRINAPTGTDLTPHKAKNEELIKKVCRLSAALKHIKLSFPVKTSPSNGQPAPNPHPQPDVKLPALELPTFSGDLQEWTSFHDLFQSAIGNKPSLTNSQKLTYLKGCLEGEPSRLIRSLVVDDANYTIAMKQLTDRYQNDRELLFYVLRRFMSQPNVNSTSLAIRKLLDTSRECIRSLESLALPVQHWDAILVYIIFNKLDNPSKELWEQSLKDSSIPKIDDLFNFLEQRARSLAAGSSTKAEKGEHKPQQAAHNHHVQAGGMCKLCSGTHLLFKCTKFNELQINQRREFVKKNSLCMNCLSDKHDNNQCGSKHVCKICKQPHHTLVHINMPPNNNHQGHPVNNQINNAPRQQHNPAPAQHAQFGGHHHQTRHAFQFHRSPQGNFQPPQLHGNVNPQQQFQPPQMQPHGVENPPQQFHVQPAMPGTISHQQPNQYDVPASPHGQGSSFNYHVRNETVQTALLATATVRVITEGRSQLCRALLDGGSETSFLSESFVRRFNLPYTKKSIQLTGLQGTNVGTSKGIARILIRPHFQSNVSYNISALVVPNVTSKQPSTQCDPSSWPHLESLCLADPAFNVPAGVDLLIGSEIFWNLLLPGKLEGGTDAPIAINSTLGWLVAGKCQQYPQTVTTHVTELQLDNEIRRFWETETIPESPAMTTDEIACENHFASTHARDNDGRFIVNIPWKTSTSSVGSSREQALRRLHQLERRLSIGKFADHVKQQQKLHQRTEYNKFMAQYEDMGHMSLVPYDDIICPKYPVAYIPHHFIEKESSTSTKFRVVFDASAKTTSNFSVNEMMMVGPTIQDSLLDIVLRFRIHPIAFTADIEKMYRQIEVTVPDRDMQRILWREDPSLPVREYRLNTVTYGTASAPYLATKCLQQLAIDSQSQFPIAAEIIKKDFYVDDLMSGSPDVATANKIVKDLNTVCSTAGFPLRKWTCNNEDVLASLPDDLKETQSLIPLNEDQSVKALGIFWNPKHDNYHFKINLPVHDHGSYTKRMILSEISKIFDPLGWLSPVLIRAKILMQSLWKEHQDWDQILPTSIQQQWTVFKASLFDLEKIKIPRCVIINSPSSVVLHGYSDASQVAYSAVVYVTCFYKNQESQSSLLISKTRVAPVHAVTLPRLELNGAHLLAELLHTVTKALKIDISKVHCFTDSTIVLAWINSSPLRWKTYVRNRVQQIREFMPNARWFHIKGEDNPADCASRGISTSELLEHPLWWRGYISDDNNSPDLSEDQIVEMRKEEKDIQSHFSAPANNFQLFHSYSSFVRLQRIVAWIFRFYNNIRKKSTRTSAATPLTVPELDQSLNVIIRVIQGEEFKSEISLLEQGKNLPTNNKLLPLSPFLDETGLLKVGGRLKHAPISQMQRFPVILPRNHFVTKIIIMDIHLKYFHAGPQLVLSIINQRFWIVRARDAVRYEIKKCVTCAKHRGETMFQFMGNLPAARLTPRPPFSVCGIDYAGPIATKPPIRSRVQLKSYLAIFICFTTKALHLEVVSTMSTDSFIFALRRFVSRRGVPTDIYSDCGTNFVGAAKKLKELWKTFNSDQHKNKVLAECTSNGINWHFNPPGSPHFGGLWEAGVKSVKHHLRRVMGTTVLTCDELSTLAIQIEALLNSRPLIPASADPSDLSALTPAHFLIGRELTALPDHDLTEVKWGQLDRFQLIQKQQQMFWKRWSREFISRLQKRPKWMQVQSQLKLGDLVIIKDDNLPPCKWKLGRVQAVHPGPDGIVRVAIIRTSDGEIKRAITKLCRLPVEHDGTSSPS